MRCIKFLVVYSFTVAVTSAVGCTNTTGLNGGSSAASPVNPNLPAAAAPVAQVQTANAVGTPATMAPLVQAPSPTTSDVEVATPATPAAPVAGAVPAAASFVGTWQMNCYPQFGVPYSVSTTMVIGPDGTTTQIDLWYTGTDCTVQAMAQEARVYLLVFTGPDATVAGAQDVNLVGKTDIVTPYTAEGLATLQFAVSGNSNDCTASLVLNTPFNFSCVGNTPPYPDLRALKDGHLYIGSPDIGTAVLNTRPGSLMTTYFTKTSSSTTPPSIPSVN